MASPAHWPRHLPASNVVGQRAHTGKVTMAGSSHRAYKEGQDPVLLVRLSTLVRTWGSRACRLCQGL